MQKSYVEYDLAKYFSDQPEKQKAISEMYTGYDTDKDKTGNICADPFTDEDSVNVVCELGFEPPANTPEGMKVNAAKPITDKLPKIKFSYLTTKIFDAVKDNKQSLDPNILAGLGYAAPKKAGANGSEVIDTTSKDWKPETIDQAMIDKYLQFKAKELAENEGFMTSIQSPDHFVLALMG